MTIACPSLSATKRYDFQYSTQPFCLHLLILGGLIYSGGPHNKVLELSDPRLSQDHKNLITGG